MGYNKIKVKLFSFNHEILTSASDKLKTHCEKTSISSIKIIPLPTHKRIYCVLRSPHVDKDSREHFEIRTHKKVVVINYDENTCSDLENYIMALPLPSGVSCELIND